MWKITISFINTWRVGASAFVYCSTFDGGAV